MQLLMLKAVVLKLFKLNTNLSYEHLISQASNIEVKFQQNSRIESFCRNLCFDLLPPTFEMRSYFESHWLKENIKIRIVYNSILFLF